MQAQAAGARSPSRSGVVTAKAGELLPVLSAVGRLEDRRVFDARVHRVGIGQRGLQMPDALELPWMRRPVVPLMRARHAVVEKLVADGFPRLAAVARPLHRLAEPVVALRCVDAIRIDRRSFEMVE